VKDAMFAAFREAETEEDYSGEDHDGADGPVPITSMSSDGELSNTTRVVDGRLVRIRTRVFCLC